MVQIHDFARRAKARRLNYVAYYRHPLTHEKCAPHSRSHRLLTAATSQGRKGQVLITTPQFGAFLKSKNFIPRPSCYMQLIQTSQSFSLWIILQQFFFFKPPKIQKNWQTSWFIISLTWTTKKKKQKNPTVQSSRDFFYFCFFTSVVDDSSIFLRFKFSPWYHLIKYRQRRKTSHLQQDNSHLGLSPFQALNPRCCPRKYWYLSFSSWHYRKPCKISETRPALNPEPP